jgi:hypothetical protein
MKRLRVRRECRGVSDSRLVWAPYRLASFAMCRQAPCTPGRWSNASGSEAACTLLCAPGYVCPGGSSAPDARPCGAPDLYCPEGTGQPLVAGPGRYTLGGLDNGTTRTSVAECPGAGVYCPGNGLTAPCAAGFFGNETRLSSASCSGPCHPGYFCVPGSTSAAPQPCGSAVVYVRHCVCVFNHFISATKSFAQEVQ